MEMIFDSSIVIFFPILLQVRECMLLLSGFAAPAIMATQPLCGLWASSSTTWCAATSLLNAMSRSAKPRSISRDVSPTSVRTSSSGVSASVLATGSPLRTSCTTPGCPRPWTCRPMSWWPWPPPMPTPPPPRQPPSCLEALPEAVPLPQRPRPPTLEWPRHPRSAARRPVAHPPKQWPWRQRRPRWPMRPCCWRTNSNWSNNSFNCSNIKSSTRFPTWHTMSRSDVRREVASGLCKTWATSQIIRPTIVCLLLGLHPGVKIEKRVEPGELSISELWKTVSSLERILFSVLKILRQDFDSLKELEAKRALFNLANTDFVFRRKGKKKNHRYQRKMLKRFFFKRTNHSYCPSIFFDKCSGAH